MKWSLLDCVAQHQLFPETFAIPTKKEVAALGAGDLAKLIFQLDKPVFGVESERMWVQVELKCGEQYVGKLVNDPVFLGQVLKYGDTVTFFGYHVAKIERMEK